METFELETAVDILVSIEGSAAFEGKQVLEKKTNSVSSVLLLDSHPLDAAEDDTFGIFSGKHSLSAGGESSETFPAEEKTATGSVNNPELPEKSRKSEASDEGVLVELGDSPETKEEKHVQDFKTIDLSKIVNKAASAVDPVIDSPFELAWDLIEEEAHTLAEKIKSQAAGENKIDLDMNTLPDSPLVSPPNSKSHQREAVLIESSPKREVLQPKTVKVSSSTKPGIKTRTRLVFASPATSGTSRPLPLKSRVSLQTPPRTTPVKRSTVPVSPSPAKTATSSSVPATKQQFKPPAMKAPLRPKVSAPVTKAANPGQAVKAGPMKASHHGDTPRPPAKSLRFVTSAAAEPAPPNPPLVRSSSTLPNQSGSGFVRQGSLRSSLKRNSVSSNSSLSSSANSSAASENGPVPKTNSKMGTPRTSLLYRSKENKPI